MATPRLPNPKHVLVASLVAVACACPSSGAKDPAAVSRARAVDPSLFLAQGLAGPVEEVPCTLQSGKSTTCLRITRTSTPTDHAQGPWCPTSIDDGPEAGGIWPEAGIAHEVTGEFVAKLAAFYKDGTWALHNDDGTINVTDSAEKCAAAARPDVDPELHNHCVECLPSYLPQGKVSETLIPKIPSRAASPSPLRSNIGLALNGVEFAAPAPTHAILAAHTLAPFDDCGGHINMHEGYHYHAVTKDCLTSIAQDDGHAPMIGYGLDGYPIHARAGADDTEPSDLDECRGHSDAKRGYHYHVAGPGKNQTLGCLTGEIVKGTGRRPPGPPPGKAPRE